MPVSRYFHYKMQYFQNRYHPIVLGDKYLIRELFAAQLLTIYLKLLIKLSFCFFTFDFFSLLSCN